MKWSWTIGYIAGIKVRMHWTFLLLLIWAAFYFTARGEDWRDGLLGVLFVLAIFVCVILHEAGHALTARRYGVPTEDITLLPIGGLARLQRIPSEPWAEFWIAIAGPAVNVVIAAVLFAGLIVAGQLAAPTVEPNLQAGFFTNLMMVNVLLVVFNLLPAFPMDGGRILRSLLATRINYVRATNIAATVGQAMAILFGIVGLLGMNPILLFIALFVYLGAEAEAQNVRFKDLLGDSLARDAMMTRIRTLSPDDSFQTAIDELLAGSQQDFPIVDEERFHGVLRRKDLVEGLREHSPEERIGETYSTVQERVHEETSLQEVVELMHRNATQSLPVFRGEELVGLVNMENITELIMVRSATAGRQPERPEQIAESV